LPRKTGTYWSRRRFFVEGGYIKPVIGSAIELYRPMEHYYGVGSSSTKQSMYLNLLSVQAPYPSSLEKIARKWGLLGLYQHHVVQVRWEVESGDGQRTRPVLSKPAELLYHYSAHWKAFGANSVQGFVTAIDDTGKPSNRESPLLTWGRLYFPDFDWIHPLAPRMTSINCAGGEWELAPALHEDFLCEPVDEVVHAITAFQETYMRCTQWSEGKPHTEAAELINKAFECHLSRPELNTVLMPGGEPKSDHTGEVDRVGRWKLDLSFPSLLGMAYYQMFQDLRDGRYMRYCRNKSSCGRAFVTDRKNSFYCCQSCRNAANLRAYHLKHAGGSED